MKDIIIWKKIMKTRPTKDEYFMEIAKLASSRSTCTRAQVWAVIVKSWIILSTWYNWSARWEETCLDIWCLIWQNWSCTRTIHAEENAIISAARLWVSLEWAVLYCTHKPCSLCSRRIINAWITEVFYSKNYDWDWSINLNKFIKLKKI